MMGTRLLASILVFVVAFADETEVEPAHVNAALGKDDQCALGAAGCAVEALQTKAVKGVVDVAEDDASAAEMKVIGDVESREEDDDHVPEIRALEDIAKWYDNATAAESRVVDAIVGTQEEFGTYLLETMAASPEDDPCGSGIVGRFRAVGPECFDACPLMCQPLADAVFAFFRRGGAPAVRRVICKNQLKFYCPMLYVNQPKCETFVTRARGMHIELPTTIQDFQEQCKKILR